jgi:hypothetical protein
MAGKGSGRRPTDEQKYQSNWDAIFGKQLKEQVELPLKEKENENELPNKTN